MAIAERLVKAFEGKTTFLIERYVVHFCSTGLILDSRKHRIYH